MPLKRFVGPDIGCLRPEAELRRRTVRFRITALATLVVALGLSASAAALVVLQRNALTSTIDQGLIQRADDIESLVAEAVVPDSFPATLTEGFVQLVGEDGNVVASSPNMFDEPAIHVFGTTLGGADFITNTTQPGVDDDEFRLLIRPMPGGGALFVGTTFDIVGESVATLTASIAVVVPILIVMFSALIWWLVGRTLQPVEDIRREVSEIGVADLHRRVPHPGTDDEIDRLAGTMNEMLQRIEASTERQQRFVADASHELRSPLTRLRTQIEVEIGQTRGEPDPVLGDLLAEVTGMQSLVEDLLYLARSDAGSGSGSFESFDLDDLVIREARRIDARGRVALDMSGVSGAHVRGEASQLTRAIRNLLENAERHAERLVSVCLYEEGGSAILEIGDDGPGIASDQDGWIFQRFGRLDEARSASTGGAGLGLPIARDIAVRHGGSLDLVAASGVGASFIMRIPLAG